MSVRAYHRSVSEVGMERTIREAVEGLGGRVWHDHDSRGRAITDMPDLLILVPARPGHPGIVALIELKSQARDLTDGQRHVVDLMAGCQRLITGVVRPEPREGEMDLDTCLDLLTGGMTR